MEVSYECEQYFKIYVFFLDLTLKNFTDNYKECDTFILDFENRMLTVQNFVFAFGTV